VAHVRALRAPASRRACVAECVDEVLYSKVFELYAAQYEREDDALDARLRALRTASLAHLGVAQPYWLLDPHADTPPYDAAVAELRHLPRMRTPAAKLRCLVNTANNIVKCVAAHCRRIGARIDSLPVSAEQLLPILAYVLIKSGVAHLHSECRFLHDFITEVAEMREEGYTLATFAMALELVRRCDEASMVAEASRELRAVLDDRAAHHGVLVQFAKS